MTGYAYVFGPCITCGAFFGFDPHRVPGTSAFTGKREALCRACVAYMNERRSSMGMDPIAVAEDAYGPNREDELP